MHLVLWLPSSGTLYPLKLNDAIACLHLNLYCYQDHQGVGDVSGRGWLGVVHTRSIEKQT